jgi:hypothetical protein
MASLGLVESDYAWVTEQIKQIANEFSKGASCPCWRAAMCSPRWPAASSRISRCWLICKATLQGARHGHQLESASFALNSPPLSAFRSGYFMKTIQGSIPAILTPMQDDGSLDLPGLQRLLDWHIAEGTDGVVIVGTTGESPTVNYDEHCALIETTVKACSRPHSGDCRHRRQLDVRGHRTGAFRRKGRCRCPSLRGALLQQADAGRSLPSFQGDCRSGRSADAPVQRAGTHGCRSANDTTLRLAQVPGIVGIKDATGNIERGSDLLKRAPPLSACSAAMTPRHRTDAAGRQGLHFGHGERRSAPDAPDVRGGDCWRPGNGARGSISACSVCTAICFMRPIRFR